MYSGAVLGILVVTGFIGLLVFVAIQSSKKKKRAIALAASVMTDPVIEKIRAAGRVHGRHVTFILGTRGSGRSQSRWTEIYVELPPIQVVVNLRRQTRYQEKLVRQGLAID